MSNIFEKARQRFEDKKNWKPKILDTCPKCNEPIAVECICARDKDPICTDCYNTRANHFPCNCKS